MLLSLVYILRVKNVLQNKIIENYKFSAVKITKI